VIVPDGTHRPLGQAPVRSPTVVGVQRDLGR
jgi:hypothetical protein